MPVAKKRLRWVVLIVVMVVPIAFTSGIWWFVASNTWLEQTKDRIEQALDVRVGMDQIALADLNIHVLSDFILYGSADQEYFRAEQLFARTESKNEQQASLLTASNYRLSLDDKSFPFLLSIMQRLQSMGTTHAIELLDSGHCGSLSANCSYKNDIFKLSCHGIADKDTLWQLARAFYLDTYVVGIPAFLSVEQLDIKSLVYVFNAKTLDTQIDLHCSWEHGEITLNVLNDLITVVHFSDERLPLFKVEESRYDLFGNPAQVQAQYDLKHSQLRISVKSDKDHFVLRLIPSKDVFTVRVEEGIWRFGLDMIIASYLPKWFKETLTGPASLAGCSWQWTVDGQAGGTIQYTNTSKQLTIRAAWALAPQLSLSSVIIESGDLHGLIKRVQFFEDHMLWDGITLLKADSLFETVAKGIGLTRCEISKQKNEGDKEVLLLDLNGNYPAQLASEQSQFSLRMDVAPMSLANALARRSLMDEEQGTCSSLSYQQQHDGASYELQCKLADVRSIWPHDLAIPQGALLVNYNAQDKSTQWQLKQSNSVWTYNVIDNESGTWDIELPLFDWRWHLRLDAGHIDMHLSDDK